MFILKFALELSLLTGLFFIFKRFVFKTFKIHENDEVPVNRVSVLNRMAYSGIFIFSGVVFSFLAFWTIYLGFSLAHSVGHYTGVLVAQQLGLITPSLIIGFYISTSSSKLIYAYFFGVKSLAMIPAYATYSSASRRVFTRIFSAMTLIPAIVLLALQFNVYLKIDGHKIYTRQMLQEEKVYAMTDVVKIAPEGDNSFTLLMADGARIPVKSYSGNVNAFLDHLEW